MSKILILIVACVATSEACSCVPFPGLQEAFCASDFVSRVKVISKKDPNAYSKGFQDVIYTVHHIHVYRKPSKTAKLPNEIYTASNSAACGIELEIGKEYLIGGSVDEQGKLHSYLCGILQKWHEVPKKDRVALRTYKCY
ncbi:hypothetical protein RB195_008537 [Necator americanus]|uniref:NTR domain-containing protein n=1 Tax=Necator americanus TaxID=51031 RepID=A0ABR1CP44_NECAM